MIEAVSLQCYDCNKDISNDENVKLIRIEIAGQHVIRNVCNGCYSIRQTKGIK